ncbi:MAG: diphosphate--fructose-6-phosphate 1-phosphotransferase [Lachnospiraceae bacterium]|nr:diphosphate--fructose-6-phosphate 1-phosphotransferase [Lachnospiraceae bacterium]
MDNQANAIYIQSGGPTAVINASAYGVITECRNQPKIHRIYASEHGILGLIKGKLFDITEKLPGEEYLPDTPSMLFGSCRYEIDEGDQEQSDYHRVLDTLRALHIRYIFINGGNGSVRAGLRLGRFLKSQDYDFSLIVVPKTVDNDISCIDHAPGYPSAARHVALTVAELARDMMTYDTELIVFAEVMGRNTGFLAAASTAARKIDMGPDLIYVPEVTFSKEKFIDDVGQVLKKKGKCFAVAAEGVKTADGRFLFEDVSINKGMDMQKNMGGITPCISQLLREHFSCKIRGIDLGLMQRCGIHNVSETDRQEAEQLGRLAVRAAVSGESFRMVTLNREPGRPYQAIYELVRLEDVAEKDNCLPLSYVTETENDIREEFLDYILPLIGTLPKYTVLHRKYI